MWKPLNPGEEVHDGDIIRYKSGPSNVYLSKEKIYQVVRKDKHYFEVTAIPVSDNKEKLDSKVIKYMDIGYHIEMEKWLDK